MNLFDIKHPDPRIQSAGRHYAAGLLREPGVRRGDCEVVEQTQRYLESVERYQMLARRVRELLDEYEMPYSVCLLYRNFAYRVRKVLDRFESVTRYVLVCEALGRAVAYGCDRPVLRRICKEVLGYDLDLADRENGP